MSETDAALYEVPFAHVAKHVKPVRQRNRRGADSRYWWRHVRPRPAMWAAIHGLSRYIVTPRVAKHRLFVWCDARICPDTRVVVVARDDDTTFGILHSRFQRGLVAPLRGHTRGPSRVYADQNLRHVSVPVGTHARRTRRRIRRRPRAAAIADAARRLVELRDRWLNPPEWVEWIDEPVPGYPKRPIPTADADLQQLKRRTLTNLYNQRPQWLANAHTTLDTAVANAYEWPSDISHEDALRGLLELNLARGG